MEKLFENTSPQTLRNFAMGIPSVCSVHPTVLDACVSYARNKGVGILIESTSNQVNQDGGYSGMKPQDFVNFMRSLSKVDEDTNTSIILGGDHLGPHPWAHLPASQAMNKAQVMVTEYVKAGYRKIHLDTSMRCADDAPGSLSKKIIAERTAELCKIAEEAYQKHFSSHPLLYYVVGSEVPPPGGITSNEDHLHITSALDLTDTYEYNKREFFNQRLASAWERVIAIVVQPGVDFGNNVVHLYQRNSSRHLRDWIEQKENLVFEAHSTDFQPRFCLREMVEDHFAILKVGPALTFAYREAIYHLALIEEILFKHKESDRSQILKVLETVMLKNPKYWQNYYQGAEEEQELARFFSFCDRIRYYWTNSEVKNALKILFNNLQKLTIPTELISQFFPEQYPKIRNHLLENQAQQIIFDKIHLVLEDYALACKEENPIINYNKGI